MFLDHSEHLFHCELDLADLDLCYASSQSNSETTFTLGTPPWRLAKVVSDLGLVKAQRRYSGDDLSSFQATEATEAKKDVTTISLLFFD